MPFSLCRLFSSSSRPGTSLHGGCGDLGRNRGQLFSYTFLKYFSSEDVYLPKIDFGASLKSIFSQFYCEEFNYIIKSSTHIIGLENHTKHTKKNHKERKTHKKEESRESSLIGKHAPLKHF